MAIRKSELYSLPHADQTLDQRPGAHPRQGPLRMLRGRLLLGKPRTNGPWRWTPSCRGTRAARTSSATCRPSASAAMPASALAVCLRKRAPQTSATCRPATPIAKTVVCSARWRLRWVLESQLALCIADADPVSPGHSLVIPRRHGSDGLALHQPEWNAVVEPLKLRREQLGAQDASISGWAGLLNARGGLNSGEAAGQSVFHAHWHLIPRRTGDDKSPRGGVRGGIKRKQHD